MANGLCFGGYSGGKYSGGYLCGYFGGYFCGKYSGGYFCGYFGGFFQVESWPELVMGR